jgi:Uma2 family endonuclease
MFTVMVRKPRHRFTYDEYLRYERESGLKHEYSAGEVFAMAGGTKRHNALKSRVEFAIRKSLAEGCESFSSDQKVYIAAYEKAVYPDILVACGALESPAFDEHAITNPLLVVEVLSASTEDYDRGEKRLAYQALSSLKEYALVAQDEPQIERYRRREDGWQYWDSREGLVELVTGAAVDIGELYARLPTS